MSGRTALFALGVLLVASIFVVYGVTLIFRPDLFLRLFDWLSPGDYFAKAAPWRKDVYNLEWKFAGAGFFATGLFFLYLCVRILLRG